ncbi:MAG TPA: hypothetical protein VFZ95_04870, partial [Steroidobacteraceae bacterium]
MKRTLLCTLLLAASMSSMLAAKPLRTTSGSPMVKLERGDGMVMLRLIQTDYVASYLPAWERFHFHDASSGKKFEVIDPYGPGHNTFFVASVPPGEYVADRVSKAKSDGSVLPGHETWGEADFFPEGGWRFRVERGRLTNLGTVFFIRPYNQAKNKMFRWAQFPDETLPARSQYLFESRDRPALLAQPVGWSGVPSQ